MNNIEDKWKEGTKNIKMNCKPGIIKLIKWKNKK